MRKTDAIFSCGAQGTGVCPSMPSMKVWRQQFYHLPSKLCSVYMGGHSMKTLDTEETKLLVLCQHSGRVEES